MGRCLCPRSMIQHLPVGMVCLRRADQRHSCRVEMLMPQSNDRRDPKQCLQLETCCSKKPIDCGPLTVWLESISGTCEEPGRAMYVDGVLRFHMPAVAAASVPATFRWPKTVDAQDAIKPVRRRAAIAYPQDVPADSVRVASPNRAIRRGNWIPLLNRYSIESVYDLLITWNHPHRHTY